MEMRAKFTVNVMENCLRREPFDEELACICPSFNLERRTIKLFCMGEYTKWAGDLSVLIHIDQRELNNISSFVFIPFTILFIDLSRISSNPNFGRSPLMALALIPRVSKR
jgi:hypothetical protein